MSLKKIPIVIGFGAIAASQFAVGVYMTAKGKGNAELLYQKRYSHSVV